MHAHDLGQHEFQQLPLFQTLHVYVHYDLIASHNTDPLGGHCFKVSQINISHI
jgi:hypothetical protein